MLDKIKNILIWVLIIISIVWWIAYGLTSIYSKGYNDAIEDVKIYLNKSNGEEGSVNI